MHLHVYKYRDYRNLVSEMEGTHGRTGGDGEQEGEGRDGETRTSLNDQPWHRWSGDGWHDRAVAGGYKALGRGPVTQGRPCTVRPQLATL